MAFPASFSTLSTSKVYSTPHSIKSNGLGLVIIPSTAEGLLKKLTEGTSPLHGGSRFYNVTLTEVDEPPTPRCSSSDEDDMDEPLKLPPPLDEEDFVPLEHSEEDTSQASTSPSSQHSTTLPSSLWPWAKPESISQHGSFTPKPLKEREKFAQSGISPLASITVQQQASSAPTIPEKRARLNALLESIYGQLVFFNPK